VASLNAVVQFLRKERQDPRLRLDYKDEFELD
jgi:hypothetical protein